MSWIDKLYQTYEACSGNIGAAGDDVALLPVCHTTNKAQIEIVVSGDGCFKRAKVIPKNDSTTVIPCTEASGGRAGSKPTCHPLCDKLQYVAADFVSHGGEVTSGFSDNSSEPHTSYARLLRDWCNSPHAHPKAKAVLAYVNKGTVMADLLDAGVLPRMSGSELVQREYAGAKDKTPAIYGVLDGEAEPADGFVRWAVEIPGDPQTQLWLDSDVWRSWSEYYASTKAERGLCFVSGELVPLATQHPSKLRSSGDKAKLISANDGSGFTFRGRFTDDTGAQACGVGFDVTQKAHSALRWLIGRQGRRDGTQAIIAWSIDGKLQDDPFADSRALLFTPEEIAEQAKWAKNNPVPSQASLAQDFARRLNRKIGGYRATLGDMSGIMVMAIDSATPGRMSVNYYRELISSEFIDRIEMWHHDCSWSQNFGINARFVGAPAPKDIAETAYGSRLDEKLLASTVRQLLPCILDAAPIPRNLIECCVRRASNRNGIEHWEWEKALGIACALYRKQHKTQRNYQMALELERDSRDYLFGRLLALAEGLEERALYLGGETRETNAGRLMQRFADNPSSTWRTIETALTPYITRLQSRRRSFLNHIRSEMDAVMSKFKTDDFLSPAKLTGEFLLGYHCQRAVLRAKPDKENEESDDESQTNSQSN
jgi:CRISPR-associated protein Csd1